MIAADIDGTLLDYDYTPGAEPAVNWPLIRQLAQRTDVISLVTNQGGLPFGFDGNLRKDGRPYPVPSDFVHRLLTLHVALAEAGIGVAQVHVCVYHQRASDEQIAAAAGVLRSLLKIKCARRFAWSIYTGIDWRKPSPLMLEAVGATTYYGDSDEDEAAATSAGIEFVKVERFTKDAA